MSREVCQLKTDADKGRAFLRVDRDTLDMGEQQAFRNGCRRLLDSGQPAVYVDLRGLRSLLSIYLDIVLEANSEARAADRRLTVLVGEKLGDLFRTVVGPELLELAYTDPE
jgi:hypothetical protein